MQPDIRIFPNAVYTARLFRCYSCIRKTKIGKYTKIFVQHWVNKVKLAREDQLSFPGNFPPIPPLSHIFP